MSPWLHDELQVFLGPERVALLPIRRTLSLRGMRRTDGTPQVLAVEPGPVSQPWRAALLALESALPEAARPGIAVTVVLSNQFVRYALVPGQPGLTRAEEELAYARHCFTQVYGEAALQWEVRLDATAGAGPRLAAAVDALLLEGLRGVFAQPGLSLRSMRPHLMAAFNEARGRMRPRQPNAWFALLEPGHLCLGLLNGGNWLRLRSRRLDGPWCDELSTALERESLLADPALAARDVYVAQLAPCGVALPEIDGWQFHSVDAEPVDAPFATDDRILTAAMTG